MIAVEDPLSITVTQGSRRREVRRTSDQLVLETRSIFHWSHDRKGEDPESDVVAPSWLNWGGDVLFVMKVLAVAAAYLTLGVYLADRLL